MGGFLPKWPLAKTQGTGQPGEKHVASGAITDGEEAPRQIGSPNDHDDLLSFDAEEDPEDFFDQLAREAAVGTFIAVGPSQTGATEAGTDWKIDLSPTQIAGDGIRPEPTIAPDHGGERAFPKVCNLGLQRVTVSGAGGARPDPRRFYDDPTYRRELAALAAAIIDAEGPINFQVLCVRIARAHGFQRTGHEIVATIRSALGRQRRMTATPDGKVCWPDGMTPAKAITFRDIPGRDWKDVPHPEKIGLVAALGPRHADLARAVASRIGLARVRAPFVAEVEALARTAAALPSD